MTKLEGPREYSRHGTGNRSRRGFEEYKERKRAARMFDTCEKERKKVDF